MDIKDIIYTILTLAIGKIFSTLIHQGVMLEHCKRPNYNFTFTPVGSRSSCLQDITPFSDINEIF